MIENDRALETGGEMANYTLKPLDEIPDVLGDYPGEMRMGSFGLDCEQIAFTWRRMPPQTGGKGSYGHRHKTQEEVYFVASGTLQFKLEDEVMDVPAGTVVRVGPEVARSVWNEGPDDAVLIMVSKKLDDPGADIEKVEDFWVE
jgi:mannose-6-phosphate isomerase-like protein (cupin superfamily)